MSNWRTTRNRERQIAKALRAKTSRPASARRRGSAFRASAPPTGRRGSEWRKAATFLSTWAREMAPGMIEATIGWPSGNCSAARGERNVVARADRLDLRHPRQDLGPGGLVIVHRAGNGAGREDAGIVAAADDDPDAPLGAARKLGRRARPARAACSASRSGRNPCRTSRDSAGSMPIVLKPAPMPAMTPCSRNSASARQPLVLSWFEIGVERRFGL